MEEARERNRINKMGKCESKSERYSLNIHWVGTIARTEVHTLPRRELRTNEAPGHHSWSISRRPMGFPDPFSARHRQRGKQRKTDNRHRAQHAQKFKLRVREKGGSEEASENWKHRLNESLDHLYE